MITEWMHTRRNECEDDSSKAWSLWLYHCYAMGLNKCPVFPRMHWLDDSMVWNADCSACWEAKSTVSC